MIQLLSRVPILEQITEAKAVVQGLVLAPLAKGPLVLLWAMDRLKEVARELQDQVVLIWAQVAVLPVLVPQVQVQQ